LSYLADTIINCCSFPHLIGVNPRNVWLIFAETNVEIITSKFPTISRVLGRGSG